MADVKSGEGGRMAGDDAQARMFWYHACRLFTEPHDVTEVAYSDRRLRAFEDVVVYYETGHWTANGAPILADCYQVKFSVRGSRAITGADLTDPACLGRKPSGNSLLQDLMSMKAQSDKDGGIYRCHLATGWQPDPKDHLSRIWRKTDGLLDLDALSKAGPKSELGKMRDSWLRHLGLDDFEKLRPILEHFLIEPMLTLDGLKTQLNDRLLNAGLVPVSEQRPFHVYDDLMRKLVEGGQHSFTREGLTAILQKAGLLASRPIISHGTLEAAVISFESRTAQAGPAPPICESMLDLFDRRAIRDPRSWDDQVLDRLESFIRRIAAAGAAPINLSLTVHASIAFAAGYYLDAKTGLRVTVVQPTRGGLEYWAPDPSSETGLHRLLKVRSRQIGQGNDLAVALSLTHGTGEDVQVFQNVESLPLSRIVEFAPVEGTGPGAVQDGAHALRLASQVSDYLKRHRTPSEREGVLRIFAAAPNGLVFRLGQLSRSFGRCQLYEYDFESNAPGAYTPSISLPRSA